MEVSSITFSTGRSATFRELSGYVQLLSDGCANDGAILPTLYYRAVASLEELDGHKLFPIEGREGLNAILKLLKGRELDELVKAYNDQFGAKAPNLGNESKPAV